MELLDRTLWSCCKGLRRLKELLDGRKRDRAAGGKRAGQGREPAEDSMELLDRRELDRRELDGREVDRRRDLDRR